MLHAFPHVVKAVSALRSCVSIEGHIDSYSVREG